MLMEDYIVISHLSLYNLIETEATSYAHHHVILREDSLITKLCVVFNCSALSSSGKSYHFIKMLSPAKVQDYLVSILLRFRGHTYVITADMCKMYCQILVDPLFRTLQLNFWRSDTERLL